MKTRVEPGELRLLRMLRERWDGVEECHFWNLDKGFNGELTFDKWLNSIPGDWIVLNDLLLEYSGTVFQIDSLLVASDKIYLFEVKNYEGDYFMEKDRWYTLSKNEIKDPLLQLRRSESMLRRMLRDLEYNYPIEPYLIFVNPEFQLYQCPPQLPFVFSSQMNRFSQKLLKKASGRLTARHSRLAEKLVALHAEESQYVRLPEYSYEDLRKGIVCVGCGCMETRLEYRTIKCNGCIYTEEFKSATIRSIHELLVLLPNKPITSNVIFEWCGGIVSKRSIQRILISNFTLVGYGKSSRYVKKINQKKEGIESS
jgi:hypothetical protein